MNYKEIKTKICPSCNTEFNLIKKSQKLCPSCVKDGLRLCTKHNNIHYRQNCPECDIEKSHIKYPEGSEYIECKICSYRSKEITNHILKIHNISTDQYRKDYNVDKLKVQSLCDKFKGENNPAYGHGGKFSPFSKNFIKYSSDEEYQNGLNNAKENSAKTKTEHPENESTKIEYYLKQGYTQEESENLLSDRQSTFSLRKCIEKYGEDEGAAIWKERQDKWQESLNSKSKEEIDEINRKKSSRFNYKFLWNGEYEDVKGLFYVIEINKNLVKIGITSRTLKKRYAGTVDKNQIKYIREGNMYDSFQLEQILKHKLKEFRITPEETIGDFGWTETFKTDSESVINIIKSIPDIKEEFKKIYAR